MWPIAFTVFYQDSLLTMNPWLAGLTLPIIVGCTGTLWVACWLGLFIEHIRDTSLENIIHPETFMKVTFATSLVVFGSFSASVYQLRSEVGVGDVASQEVAAAAVFTCTWPCLALRGVTACAFGAGMLALLFICRAMLVGPEDERQCLTCHRQNGRVACLNYSHAIVCATVLAGSVVEAYNGFLFKVPVEDLVTGPAILLYLIVPCLNTLGLWMAAKCFVWASPPRIRMLSRLYRAHTWVAIVTFVGSSWLLYILRDSVVDAEMRSLSGGEKAILWQAAAIPYVGTSLILWCWGTERAERRRRSWICPRVLLWISAASWPLIAAGVADDAILWFSGRERNRVICCLSLALGLGGFMYELVSFVSFRGVLRNGQAMWAWAWAIIAACGLLVFSVNYSALSA